MMTTAYYLDALVREGLSHAFLVPGGLIDPFLEDLAGTPGLVPIVAAHEGGAACMADGYARASGRFGVCLCIGGPGVTNTLTGMVAASTDNSPVLLISGQVPTNWEGRGGFQDSSPATLNDLAMLGPAVRKSLAVENIHLAGHHLRSALTAMLSGARGPGHSSGRDAKPGLRRPHSGHGRRSKHPQKASDDADGLCPDVRLQTGHTSALGTTDADTGRPGPGLSAGHRPGAGCGSSRVAGACGGLRVGAALSGEYYLCTPEPSKLMVNSIVGIPPSSPLSRVHSLRTIGGPSDPLVSLVIEIPVSKILEYFGKTPE
ncbi:hypothetical protein GD605_08425 [Desulfolutivibrio sulfoxidireducens]|nr:hypothetical protein GD605_08425 [Desulfolutivibrio sulfoxidireducens]